MIKRIWILLFCSLLCLALFPSYAEPPVNLVRSPSTERFALVIADNLGAGDYVWPTSRGEFMPALSQVHYSNHDCSFVGGKTRIRMRHTVRNSPNIPPRSGEIWVSCQLAQGPLFH